MIGMCSVGVIFPVSEHLCIEFTFLQKGDLLLNVNGVSLLGKTHTEAIQLIKSVMGSSLVQLELIQGEGSRESGGLSPDWGNWIKKYEAANSGHQR